jgi:hypothetical protein
MLHISALTILLLFKLSKKYRGSIESPILSTNHFSPSLAPTHPSCILLLPSCTALAVASTWTPYALILCSLKGLWWSNIWTDWVRWL